MSDFKQKYNALQEKNENLNAQLTKANTKILELEKNLKDQLVEMEKLKIEAKKAEVISTKYKELENKHQALRLENQKLKELLSPNQYTPKNDKGAKFEIERENILKEVGKVQDKVSKVEIEIAKKQELARQMSPVPNKEKILLGEKDLAKINKSPKLPPKVKLKVIDGKNGRESSDFNLKKIGNDENKKASGNIIDLKLPKKRSTSVENSRSGITDEKKQEIKQEADSLLHQLKLVQDKIQKIEIKKGK